MATARHVITTAAAPASPLYSQGVRVGSTIYVSGMVGMDAATGEMAGSTIQDDFAGLNEEYARAFPADPPARALARLGVELPNVLVSILMIARLSSSPSSG